MATEKKYENVAEELDDEALEKASGGTGFTLEEKKFDDGLKTSTPSTRLPSQVGGQVVIPVQPKVPGGTVKR